LDASRWDGEGEGDAGDFHLKGSHPRGADGHGVFDFGWRAAYFEVAYLAGEVADCAVRGVEIAVGFVEAALQEAVPCGFAGAVFRRFTGLTLVGRVNVVVDRRHLLAFGVLLGPWFWTPHSSCFCLLVT
jgi:hypothetical protein